MKKTFFLATVVLAPGFAVALIVRFAGYTSFNTLSVPAIIGGVFVCGLVPFAFSDYSRKPRFRARSATLQAAKPATSSDVDAASSWTYTTVSA